MECWRLSNELSTGDVAALLAEPSEERRTDIAVKVGQQLKSPALSPRERTLALQIVTEMVRDTAVRVRSALSGILRDNGEIPHEVALRLARDVDIVALPMLEHSPLLTDDDLIAIVRDGSGSKQIAVARRAELPGRVSGAIVAFGVADSVAALLDNAVANLPDDVLEQAADRFGNVEAVQIPLIRRNLPVSVAERLLNFTSETLRAYFATVQYVRQDIAEAVIRKLREEETVRLRPRQGWSEETETLAGHLFKGDRLTPSLILRALCVGNTCLFEAALATLAKIPVTNAYRLIHDASGVGFEQLYRAARLPERLFPAFKAALLVAHQTAWDFVDDPDATRYSQTMIWRILTQFEDFDADDLDYLLLRHDLPP
jgi:uncharacterized protein (DUF2336 family)